MADRPAKRARASTVSKPCASSKNIKTTKARKLAPTKPAAGPTPAEDEAMAIMRRHFESQFEAIEAAPPAPARKTVGVIDDGASDEDAAAGESDWDGIESEASDGGSDVDEDDADRVIVVHHGDDRTDTRPVVTKREKRMFMVCAPLRARARPANQVHSPQSRRRRTRSHRRRRAGPRLRRKPRLPPPPRPATRTTTPRRSGSTSTMTWRCSGSCASRTCWTRARRRSRRRARHDSRRSRYASRRSGGRTYRRRPRCPCRCARA